MIVELFGPPGSGKTSVLPHLVSALSRESATCLPAEAAIEWSLSRRGRLRRIAVLFGGRRRTMRMLLVDIPYGIAFMAANARLSATVVLAILRSPVGLGHRWTLFTRWGSVAARQRYLRRRAAGVTAVFDEGLYHRAINLFAWRSLSPAGGEARASEIARYIALTPPPSLAVYVDAPEELARRRVAERGLPIRLRGRSADDVRAFLDAATRIARIVAEQTASRRVLHVSTAGTLDVTMAELEAALSAVSRNDAHPGRREWPVEPSRRGPRLRRPDRRWKRRSRDVARAELAELHAVADELGLGSIRAGLRVGKGRSSSIVADTEGGRVVIKRYKETVEADGVLAEHRALSQLAALDAPTPRLIPTSKGTTLVETGSGRYAAFEYAPGYVPSDEIVRSPRDHRRAAAAAGRALALLHESLAGLDLGVHPSAGLDPVQGRRTLSADLARSLEAESGISGADAAERLCRLDAELMALDLERTVVHGDYGPYNILVRPGERLFIIDFELARADWRLVDIATAVPRFCLGRVVYSAAAAEAFIDGYLDASPALRSEVRRVPTVLEFLSLRRAAVCAERHRATGIQRWRAEARAQLRKARALRSGRHPVARHWLELAP